MRNDKTNFRDRMIRLMSEFRFRISDFEFRISNFGFRISDEPSGLSYLESILKKISTTKTPKTKSQHTLKKEHIMIRLMSEFRFRISDFEFRISNFGFRISDEPSGLSYLEYIEKNINNENTKNKITTHTKRNTMIISHWFIS
jgi:hypothetical protein